MHVLELRIPPVALTILFGLAMWLAAVLWPDYRFYIPLRMLFAGVVAILGATFAVAGVAAFRKARTTVNPLTPVAASVIVASGVYRLSRNPMYTGLAFVLAAWAVFLSHPAGFTLLAVFVPYMTWFQIMPEERALAEKFGAGYARYKAAVRRWL